MVSCCIDKCFDFYSNICSTEPKKPSAPKAGGEETFPLNDMMNLNEGMDKNLESKRRNASEKAFNKIPKVCSATISFS